MKYHSNPKPVRIRIESGEEEHFSLDSLLRCFNPKDILGKKNELLRWLEFQGEEGESIGDVLCKIEDFSADVFGVYKAFFNQYIENKHITKIEELYYSWSKEESYKKNFKFLKELYKSEIVIELDGEYLSSLEELQWFFNPEEIFMKKDELLRWLEFQGEEGERIIKELHDIEFNRDHVYDIYKAFFSTYIKEHNITKLTELYAQWHAEDIYRTNFVFLKVFCYNDEMFLERLYTEKCTKELESDWLGVIETFVFKHYCVDTESNVFDIQATFRDKIGNPNLLYFLGILYKENDEFDKAKMILNIAEEKGCKKQIQELINEIDNIMDQLMKKDRFYDVRKEVIIKYIEYMFNKWTNNWYSFNDAIRDYEGVDMPTSEKEKAILRLTFNYKDALTLDIGYSRPSRRYVRIKDITKTDEHDFLKKEKDFIRIISGYDEGGSIEVDSRKEMKALSETYIPARLMIDKSYKNELLDKSQFRTKNVPDRVKIILCNMFSFEE